MKTKPYFLLPLILCAAVFCIAQSNTVEPRSLSDLKAHGAFSFPQKDARVLHEDKNLRFSVTNNSDYLCAQAILWNDGDSSNETLDNDEAIGDYSVIMFLLGSDKKRTPDLDRFYTLNPHPNRLGLYYSVVRDAVKLGFAANKFVASPLQHNTQGQGRIDYISTIEGKTVRVDTFLIPLGELSKRQGETVSICYFGYSPKPLLIVNSAGFKSNKRYYEYQIPIGMYHKVRLDKEAKIDVISWSKPK